MLLFAESRLGGVGTMWATVAGPSCLVGCVFGWRRLRARNLSGRWQPPREQAHTGVHECVRSCREIPLGMSAWGVLDRELGRAAGCGPEIALQLACKSAPI